MTRELKPNSKQQDKRKVANTLSKKLTFILLPSPTQSFHYFTPPNHPSYVSRTVERGYGGGFVTGNRERHRDQNAAAG